MSGTSRGAILCPECRKLIDAGEKRCPYCQAPLPGLMGGGAVLGRLFGERLDMVVVIPIAAVVVYLFSLALDIRTAVSGSSGPLGILAPSGRALDLMGMTSRVSLYVRGDWWTILTAIYLHGNLLHIFFNLLWLRQLAHQVGAAFGPARFFVIFTVSGAAGFLLSNVVSGAPTVGASGSIFGLLAALIVYGRKIGGSFGAMLSRQLWQWAIVLFAFGFLMPQVNNFAHFGGFAAGWLTATFTSPAHRQERRGVVIVALVLLCATLYGFATVALRIASVFTS